MKKFYEFIHTYARHKAGHYIIAHSCNNRNSELPSHYKYIYFNEMYPGYQKVISNNTASLIYYYYWQENEADFLDEISLQTPVFLQTNYVGQKSDNRGANFLTHSIAYSKKIECLDFYPFEIFLKDIWKKTFPHEEDNSNFRYDFSRSERATFANNFQKLMHGFDFPSEKEEIIKKAATILVHKFNNSGFKLFIRGDYMQLFNIIASITLLFPQHLAKTITFRNFTSKPENLTRYRFPHIIGVPDDIDFDFQTLKATGSNYYLIDSEAPVMHSRMIQGSEYVNRVVDLVGKREYEKVQKIYDKIKQAGIDRIDSELDEFIKKLDFVHDINEKKPEEIKSFIGANINDFIVKEAFSGLKPEKIKEYLQYLLNKSGYTPSSWDEALTIMDKYMDEAEKQKIVKSLIYKTYEHLSRFRFNELKQLNDILKKGGAMLFEPQDQKQIKALIRIVFDHYSHSNIHEFMQGFKELFSSWVQKYQDEVVAYWIREKGKPAVNLEDLNTLKRNYGIRIEDVLEKTETEKTLKELMGSLSYVGELENNLKKLRELSSNIYKQYELELLMYFVNECKEDVNVLADIRKSNLITAQSKDGVFAHMKSKTDNERFRWLIVSYLIHCFERGEHEEEEFLSDDKHKNTALIEMFIVKYLNQLKDNSLPKHKEFARYVKTIESRLQKYPVEWSLIYAKYFKTVQKIFVNNSIIAEREEFDMIQQFFDETIKNPILREYPLFFIRKIKEVNLNQLVNLTISDSSEQLDILYFHILIKSQLKENTQLKADTKQFNKYFDIFLSKLPPEHKTRDFLSMVRIVSHYYAYSGIAISALLAKKIVQEFPGQIEDVKKSIELPPTTNYPHTKHYLDEIKMIVLEKNKSKGFLGSKKKKPILHKNAEELFDGCFKNLYEVLEYENKIDRWIELVNEYFPGFSLYYIIVYAMKKESKKINVVKEKLREKFPEVEFIIENI